MRILKTDNTVGAAFMCASMAGFAFNDAVIKSAASDMSIYQAIFIRGVFTLLLVGAFAWMRGAFRILPGQADRKRIAWRSVAEVGATLCFLTGLAHMPIANITAILQILPLTITIAAAVFLREYFGWRRGVAIAIGCLGAFIIIRPGSEDFNVYALFGLAAVGFVTWRDLIVRNFSPDVSSLFVTFITAVVITGAGAVANVLFGAWSGVTIDEILYLALAAVFLFAGYYFSVAAMRLGDVATVTPFRYTVMIWAIFLGWLIWGDVPDIWTFLGIFIVVGTGIYTLWREQHG